MRIWVSALAATMVAAPVPAMAAVVTVDAFANSSTGGVAKATGLVFAAGKQFKVSSSTNDLWSAGSLPRFSDANGLVADRFATAADDSGQPVGTQIGANFGLYNQGNLSAAYGTLVAQVGLNTYQALGANGIFTSQGSPLNLVYWDSNNSDNTGSITFNISAVPEPATWGMMILGMAGVGVAARRRRSAKAALA